MKRCHLLSQLVITVYLYHFWWLVVSGNKQKVCVNKIKNNKIYPMVSHGWYPGIVLLKIK
jgi:hypothetical protein